MARNPVRRLRVAPGGGSPRTGVRLRPDRDARELASLIALAEELGFDEVWLGDEGPHRDPFGILAAAAPATTRIRLGLGVTNPYLRRPVLSAIALATVNELSGGRAVLGVGAGGPLTLKPFGLAPQHPEAAVRRFLETARAIATGHPGGIHPEPGAADDPGEQAAGPLPLPLYVGARGPRLNRLASELADGALVSGLPPFRYREVIGWARSVRPIEIALYPSAAFSAEALAHHRAELVWALLDTPQAARTRLGVDTSALRATADALAGGDPEPARALITDSLQEQLMLVGEPAEVGQRLAALVREHRPDAIGLALAQADLELGLHQAAEALGVMRRLSATA